MSISENSNDVNVPAVKGTHTGDTGSGVEGISTGKGFGVYGHSELGRGVVATSVNDYGLRAHSGKSAGLRSSSDVGRGVEGWAVDSEGVHGISTNGTGVWGLSTTKGVGVAGSSTDGAGVVGDSKNSEGVRGISHNRDHGGVVGVNDGGGIAVFGTSDSNSGVVGESRGNGAGGYFTSANGEGVHGETRAVGVAGVAGIQLNDQSIGAAVYGENRGNSTGGFFTSNRGEGVHGETRSTTMSSVAGIQLNPDSGAAALYAEHRGANGVAGFFKGNVIVTGDLSFPGADFAEDFTIAPQSIAEPGTVMSLGDTGELVASAAAYEKRVVGVVPGAGTFRTGIVMDKQLPGDARRQPIALVGKVFCKADAGYAPIEIGDLLTTSTTIGHAMKATDPSRAFGSVIGKAMSPLPAGRGLIPVLISLQ